MRDRSHFHGKAWNFQVLGFCLLDTLLKYGAFHPSLGFLFYIKHIVVSTLGPLHWLPVGTFSNTLFPYFPSATPQILIPNVLELFAAKGYVVTSVYIHYTVANCCERHAVFLDSSIYTWSIFFSPFLFWQLWNFVIHSRKNIKVEYLKGLINKVSLNVRWHFRNQKRMVAPITICPHLHSVLLVAQRQP